MIKNCLQIAIISLVCFFAISLPAADWPAAELSAGPSLLRIADQDLLGGQFGIAVNRWQHVSLVGTFGYHQGNQKIRFGPLHRPPGRCDDDNGHPSDRDKDHDNNCPFPEPISVTTGTSDVYTYMGGGRLRMNTGPVTVFAQGQAGGARVAKENGLSISAGGGAQFSISQRFAIQALVEYLRIRVGGKHLDDGLQATVGIVIRFSPWWGGYRKP